MDDMMKIGLAIDYNFSKEFPGAYDNNLSGLKDQETETVRTDRGHQAVYYWMEKYISLLERYNEILNCKMDKAEN
jgi:hypothetical protein